jgi:hypothetical protein
MRVRGRGGGGLFHTALPSTVTLQSQPGTRAAPVGVLDRTGVAVVDTSVDVSASVSLAVEDEGRSGTEPVAELEVLGAEAKIKTYVTTERTPR